MPAPTEEQTARRRSGELIAKCRSICDAALDAGADKLTGAQQRDYDAATGELDYIRSTFNLDWIPERPATGANADFSALRSYTATLEKRVREPMGEPTRPAPSGTAWAARYTTDGIRALTREQRMADLPSIRNQPGADLGFSQWLRARITGDWSGIDPAVRAMSVGDDVLGGFLLPDALSANLIDLARAQSVVMQLGAITVPMETGTLGVPSLEGDVGAVWHVENAEESFSDASFGLRELKAKTVMALSRLSVELAEDGQDPTGVIERSMTQAIALAIDLAALRGNGVGGSPLGIRYWPDVTITELGSGNGGAVSYDDLLDLVGRRKTANEQPNGVAWSPRTAATVAKLKFGDGEYIQYVKVPDSLIPIPRLESSQIPINLTTGNLSTTTEIYVGDWSQLLVGLRTGLTISPSRVPGMRSLQVWLAAYQRVDFVVSRSAAFEVLTGVTS
jgi:HK97 family phage major capsid protein